MEIIQSPCDLIPPQEGFKTFDAPHGKAQDPQQQNSLMAKNLPISLGQPSNESKPLLSTEHSQRERKSDVVVKKEGFFYYALYALINAVISIPCLYGYATVIFNHDAFYPHIAQLSKLIIWSSAVHQLVFASLSSLTFAKAEVQDAGLIFLSSISNFIATTILEEGGSMEEVLSTTIVALGVATATLGVVLVLMGKFNYANLVAYLPLPVVGGYLSFIGYFCLVAGIGMCISKSTIDGGFFSDIQLLCDKESAILAAPGLIAGLIMMIVSRQAKSDAALPFTMVIIPFIFFVVIQFLGWSIEDARQHNWVAHATPPSPVMALFDLVDLKQVRWDLIFASKTLTTWLGMVFVVSFSSCLDVAAIGMDMGESLDVNKELAMVGYSNLISGLLFGQTGSYIFSQTIFTYRTGYHSRWIGGLNGFIFLAVVVSPINFLEITPLFFLGSTLIFIGFDLLFEWLYEVRNKLLFSEYIVLLATFVAIQIVGIDGGIVFGVIVAVVDYVVTTSRASSLRRVMKRSRAIRQVGHMKYLHGAYENERPKIMTLEVREAVFFGSSQQLLTDICEQIGVSASKSDMIELSLVSPGLHSGRTPSGPGLRRKQQKNYSSMTKKRKKSVPRFVVLDLTHVPTVDASAARGCFLQLARICKKNEIILCMVTNPRVAWILRSHDVAFNYEEGTDVKDHMFDPHNAVSHGLMYDRIILFDTVNEALELCECKYIDDIEHGKVSRKSRRVLSSSNLAELDRSRPSNIFCQILGIEGGKEEALLKELDETSPGQIEEQHFQSGDIIFDENVATDAFYVILQGAIAVCTKRNSNRGVVRDSGKLGVTLLRDREVATYVNVGGVFGYVDFKLGRRRSFTAVCSKEQTIVGKITHTMMDRLKVESPDLYHLIERVLLQVSITELASTELTS